MIYDEVVAVIVVQLLLKIVKRCQSKNRWLPGPILKKIRIIDVWAI